jgi:DNA-binding winged helix-turn-helix (wHTH) protein
LGQYEDGDQVKHDGERSPHTQNGLDRRVRFGPYEADFHTQEFWKHGVRWKLSGQPLQILEVLLACPGELVTREEIQKRLWPEGTFTDFNHSLNAAVKKLREALNDSPDDPKYIETLPRRGYRFVGVIEPPVERVAGQVSTALQTVEAPPQPPAENAVPTQTMNLPARRPSRFGLRLVAALLSLSAVALVGALVFDRLHSAGQRSAGEGQRPGHLEEFHASPPVRAYRTAPAQAGQADAHPDTIQLPIAEAPIGLREPVVPRVGALMEPSATVRTVISGDSNNAGPQFSPDGKRLAFMSNRSGNWQIWVSGSDGSNPMQLTFGEGSGTPRWSPDGRSIAYDSGGRSIFVVSVDVRDAPRRLVDGLVPSFSRDGHWVYFASERTGDWQVWKISLDDGTQKQVTYNGGFSAQESTDGYVYYSKSRYPNPGICRVPLEGGGEECTLAHLRPRTWSSWAVTRAGILFVEDLPEGKSELSFYEPDKRRVSSLVTLPSAPFWMGATADGKKAIVNDGEERQISMILLR